MGYRNWTLSCRLLGAATVLVAVVACSSPSTPMSTAALATQSEAVSREAAAAQAEINSALYGTSGAPTTTSSDPTTADTTTTGKFTRTWTKDYSATTCKEFMTVMTGQQGFVAAADMLVNARRGTDPSLSMPSDDLINMFQNDIQTGCDTDMSAKQSIVEVATAIILIDNKQNYLK